MVENIKKYLFVTLAFCAATLFANCAFAQSEALQPQSKTELSQSSVLDSENGDDSGILDSSKLFSVSHDDQGIEMHAERAKVIVRALYSAAEKISPDLARNLQLRFVGFPMISIVAAVGFVFFAWILQTLIVVMAFGALSKIFTTVKAVELRDFVECIKRPVRSFIMCAGFNVATFMLIEHTAMITFAGRFFWCLYYIIFFWSIGIVSDFFFDRFLSRLKMRYKAAVNLCQVGKKLVRILLVFFAGLVILDFLGANISAVIASLGIGGAALAFASKDTIANFFGSVSLVIDRPFAIGDWIVAGGVEGIVESIGMRSTRIRTFAKTIVTIPNSVLANESVDNMSKMPLRRERFSFGVTYSATPKQMLELVDDVRALLDANEFVDSETILVNFTNFGDSSLDILVQYYTQAVDFAGFCKVRQKVNVDIMEAVYKRGLSFAFPSRSIYLETLPKAAENACKMFDSKI